MKKKYITPADKATGLILSEKLSRKAASSTVRALEKNSMYPMVRQLNQLEIQRLL